ncbi:GTPase HflX, partial [archaeon]
MESSDLSQNEVHIQTTDRAIVVGVGLKVEPLSEIKENLLELEELVGAAGGEIVGSLIQTLPAWNPATLIGSGKVEEIREMVEEARATVVVVDHQLSGVQTRNLVQSIGARVI